MVNGNFLQTITKTCLLTQLLLTLNLPFTIHLPFTIYRTFTIELENSSIDLDFKKHFFLELNYFIYQQINSNLHWCYDPLNAIEDVNTKILSVEHRISIKI
jgi:hypothetical protein